ncbi:MAG: sensor histidine kinase, partial [Ruminococcus sp.]|nr:sensor histidine kinase [Ruminococcus sp.]
MRSINRLFIILIAVYLLLAAGVNVFMIKNIGSHQGLYRVEAKRLCDDIAETGSYDLSEYPRIMGVYTEEDGDIFDSDEHYLISEINGRLYRIEYYVEKESRTLLIVDVILALMTVMLIVIFIYIKLHIIKPFVRLNEVPRELAKGNLAVEIPEEKSRYFGKFTWGVNMLREKIESDRRRELSLCRDKKLLLLSLSHDIKTPLSAIKLNAKAL